MNDEEARFKFQEQFGRPYNEEEFLIFNVAVRYPETIVSSRTKSHQKHHTKIHYYVKNHWLEFIACIACDFDNAHFEPVHTYQFVASCVSKISLPLR